MPPIECIDFACAAGSIICEEEIVDGGISFVLSADFLQSSTSDSPHVKELVRKEEHVV
jgi:hypothetical protein